MTSLRRILLVALVGLLLPATARASEPNHRLDHARSTNWSGYANYTTGPYTSVSASWTQPSVNCNITPTGYASFWDGLDGYNTSTVEQTGTEGECQRGHARYFAWYEMYPAYPVNLSTTQYPVTPGDTFTSSVTALGGGQFKLVLTDVGHWTNEVTKTLSSAKLGSAEVIAEAPSSGRVLPLADFGTASFLSSSLVAPEKIAMVTNNGKTVKAEPGPFEAGGGFTDTWQHS